MIESLYGYYRVLALEDPDTDCTQPRWVFMKFFVHWTIR